MLSSEMLRDGFCVNSIPSPAGLPGKQEVGEGGEKLIQAVGMLDVLQMDKTPPFSKVSALWKQQLFLV